MMLAFGIAVPNGVTRRSPGPAGPTATKLRTAAVAGPTGIPQLAPPCAAVSPVTRRLRGIPTVRAPAATRVPRMRQGVTAV